MRFVTMIFLLVCSNVWANSYLAIDDGNNGQFVAEVDAQNFLQLNIKNKKTGKTKHVKFNHTISDFQKIVVEIPNGKQQKQLELYLVVLASSSAVQNVIVFSPSESQKTDTERNPLFMCNKTNYGNFYWDNPQELRDLIKVKEEAKQTNILLMIQSKEPSVGSAAVKSSAQLQLCGALPHGSL
ncbi:MAG: hypothetical protein H6623_01360 [Bdellovibrionaceae bacterium]|nr:hypothetical protein [Pseudobdellovibrionaceae bacterium]